jgi:hypothetical protein
LVPVHWSVKKADTDLLLFSGNYLDINTVVSGANMRLKDIDGGKSAAGRMKLLTANADTAQEQARRVKAQADATADGVDAQKERQKRALLQRVAVTKVIRPHK